MAEEVLNTYEVLRQLVKTFSSTRLDLEDVEMLIDLARQCRDIISSMNQYLEGYFAHRQNDSDETEIRYKVEELRNALQFRNSLLNSHYANVMLRTISLTSEERDVLSRQTLARIEKKVNDLAQHIEQTIIPQPVDSLAADLITAESSPLSALKIRRYATR
ncbi:uncharacterized protein J4E79_011013 [Alternaria viburni]|uniref:uncharacterized protein n=1 Tax=Alternaria viburni TaxID=566460 RepID=UPI0020C32DC8|nr:uncharacterized protein J4E79_011013 [Alternaria viburni]KAI4644576.1 hypothetical protein J4E79_011013 [Alternaria viburni]